MPGFKLRRVTVALILLASVGAARAELIVQKETFSLIGGGGLVSDLIAFDAFDDSLGELNKATFWLNMNLMYTLETAPLIDQNGDLYVTNRTGVAEQSVDGLGWDFEFSARCTKSATFDSGQTMQLPAIFDLTWTSDALSELIGSTTLSGTAGNCQPEFLNPVKRSDYIATPVTAATGLMLSIRSLWSVTQDLDPAIALQSGSGFAMLTYDYTPHQDEDGNEGEDESVTVPEPRTTTLLAIGLLGAGLARRRIR